MDFNQIKDQVSNLSLYDLKAGVRKVQNAVMNYTEMESKVREATNNEPWGASSSLMQEIANGTHSYQLLNEIMPMIYKRFTDKSAEEWRQIYKALQLLEFLVKNGSERVIDDARSHLSLLRMLRQFHFIDQNGKDQGVNVRNRAQELAKLLSDVEAIRSERKKARANRNKFGGMAGGTAIGGGLGGSGRFGGFGSESGGFGSDSTTFGGYSGGVFGDGGGFGGSTGGFQDSGRRGERFEEYDEYDEGGSTPARRADPSPAASNRPQAKKPEPPKQPEPDLFDFGDDEPTPAPSKAAGNGLSVLDSTPVDDDDFDDFQSAPAHAPSSIAPPSTATTTTSTQFVAPKPVSGTQGANINDLVGFSSITPTPSSSGFASPVSPPAAQPLAAAQQAPRPSGFQAAQPNYYTSVQTTSQPAQPMAGSRPSISSTTSFSSTTNTSAASKPAAAKAGGDAFGSLWSSASANAGIQKQNTGTKGPNLASMAKEKASAGIWGAPAQSTTPSYTTPSSSSGGAGQQKTGGSAFDDLLG